MTNEDREMLIEYLIWQTGYSRRFFEKLSDEKIECEFEAQQDWG